MCPVVVVCAKLMSVLVSCSISFFRVDVQCVVAAYVYCCCGVYVFVYIISFSNFPFNRLHPSVYMGDVCWCVRAKENFLTIFPVFLCACVSVLLLFGGEIVFFNKIFFSMFFSKVFLFCFLSRQNDVCFPFPAYV